MHHYSAYDYRDVADARVFSKIKRRRLETRPIELDIHHARARPASRVRASDSPRERFTRVASRHHRALTSHPA